MITRKKAVSMIYLRKKEVCLKPLHCFIAFLTLFFNGIVIGGGGALTDPVPKSFSNELREVVDVEML